MSNGLILFVHGLGGDAEDTWPRFPELIREDLELKNYDVHFFGYPTSLFSFPWSKKRPKIQTLSEALRSEINNRFPGRRDIILVCHSLGGLVGRKYVLEEVKRGTPLRVQGLLLYATPNTGAALASIASFISWRHNQLRQLCRDADIIRELGTDWFTFGLGQKLSVKYVAAGLDGVVDELSAREFWGNTQLETVVDRGHINLVKPNAASDLSFLILKNFARSLRNVQDQPEPREALQRCKTTAGKKNTQRRPSTARFRVIGFDVDGTLLRGSEFSWTLVWKFLGVPDIVSKEAKRKYVTSKRTFKDYQDWCDHDFKHLRQKGLRRRDFEEITKNIVPTVNLREALQILRNEGFTLAIISGGIDVFVYEKIPHADDLFDYICINRFSFDDQGIISGIEATPFDFAGKAAALAAICEEHGTTLESAVFVGEGYNDADVANVAGLSIAYPPNEQVTSAASRVEITEDDLLKIIEHVI